MAGSTDARTVLRGSTAIESQEEGWPTYCIKRRHGSNPGAHHSTSPFAPVSLCRDSLCLRWKGHMNTHAVVEDEKRVETAVKERSRPATMGLLLPRPLTKFCSRSAGWIPVSHSAREERGRLFFR